MQTNEAVQHPWCKGKVIAVTGGARGIGRSIARGFGRYGARVYVCDKDEEGGAAAVAEMTGEGMQAFFVKCDLSRKGAAGNAVREVARQGRRLDVLINNAKAGSRVGLLEETEESWDEGMAVTLKAAFFASQEAIRLMGEIGGGAIVNIASITSRLVCQESPAYHIAKAGMLQMTRYLALNAGERNVRVNAVMPGLIVQDEHRARYEREDNAWYRELARFVHPVRRAGTSDDVVRAVLFLASPDAGFVTGDCLCADGGSTLHEQFILAYRLKRHST